MRTLNLGFKAHVESGATTLATCWRIARTDGVTLGFTDHDDPLVFDGTRFEPMLEGGEASQKLGPQTDTSEVVGVLTSEAIAEEDILLGRFDGASVETWRVNWRDVGQRLLQRRATIGEITREDGVFRAELRSAQAALNQVRGRLYQALCDAELGDARCGVDVSDSEFRAEAVVSEVRDRFRIAATGVEAYAEGWFGFGTAVWGTGKRAGLRDRVVSHQRLGDVDVLGFGAPVGDWVMAGDQMVVTAGCDRRLATCREKFDNVVNFRGFPHIPGSDFVLHYPRQGDELDGRALY
ncbi:MAG TPA: DUF2163 domain-containing protein [Devosia sp.]